MANFDQTFLAPRMSCFGPILATITEGSAYFAMQSSVLSENHPKKKNEKNTKKMKNSFFKKSQRLSYKEIHTGAFFPDGKTPVDCISGVKDAFGVHLGKKSCRPMVGPDPKTIILWPTSAHFCPKVHLGLGQPIFSFFLPEYF